MLKRLGVVGAAVAVAALAVGSVGPATGSGGADHGHDRDKIKVVSTITEEAEVDVGKRGFSLGDMFVFTAKLTKHHKKVGHAGVVCTITSVKKQEAQCLGTAKFRHGQITVQGLVGDDEVFELAITGGTGAFEGAGGTLVVKEISDEKELLTFYIID
jgi:hypothetical protein